MMHNSTPPAARGHARRQPRLGCGAAALLALLALAPARLHAQEMDAPPQTVATMIAHATPWRDSMTLVGSLRAVRGADLALDVSGIADQISFTSGADVAAGTVLMRLRPNDDPARLAEARAQLDLARANLARDEKQIRVAAISAATLDADRAALQAAAARADAIAAQIEEKTLRAPFAGRLGVRQIDPGQYLNAGTTIVTLQALDQLYLDFYVPQQVLGVLGTGGNVGFTVDAYPGKIFAARIDAISPKLDSDSRMAQVRASLPNADHRLSPGMFATVSLAVGAPQNLITLPSAAVIYNTYGSAVYVVVPGNPKTVKQVLVKTGGTRGDQVAITAGLREGEEVVTAGQIKLRPGAPVIINNLVQPANDPAPNPREG